MRGDTESHAALNVDVMEIRRDNGEQTTTLVEDQVRIPRNMEREMAVVPARKGKGYRAPDWFGGLFRGLTAEVENCTAPRW